MQSIQEANPDQLLGALNEFEAKNAPKVLYFQGDSTILKSGARVSIVGSRKASATGIARASRLARLIVESGGVVVSGLAKGIDTAAHKSAIKHNGKTIGVIGTPLDKSYPAENKNLQSLIAREHLLISQFAIGTRTYPGSFPQRNRTMALIADATVIIEAANSSGSLKQGWEALRLGRQLWISEALVNESSLTWTAEMLEYGAQVLSNESVEILLDGLPVRRLNEADVEVSF